MKELKSQEELLFLIENKRNEMVLAAAETGLQSHQTIKTSKELDELLNLHNKLCGMLFQA